MARKQLEFQTAAEARAYTDYFDGQPVLLDGDIWVASAGAGDVDNGVGVAPGTVIAVPGWGALRRRINGYVSPAMWGASFAGVKGADDAAVAAAHAAANDMGISVVYPSGDFYPDADALIPVSTSTDISRLRVLFRNDNLSPDSYTANAGIWIASDSNAASVDTAAINASGLPVSAVYVPGVSSRGMVSIATTTVDCLRNGTDPVYRVILVRTGAGGRIIRRTALPVAAGSVSSMTFVPDAVPIEIRLPSVDVSVTEASPSAGPSLFRVSSRSNVKLSGGFVSDSSTEASVGCLIGVFNSSGTEVVGFRGAPRFTNGSGGVYVLQYGHVVDFSTRDVRIDDDTTTWGAIAGNHALNPVFACVSANRIDFHWGVDSPTYVDVNLTRLGIFMSGLIGRAKIVRPTMTSDASGSATSLVTLRGDYGSQSYAGASIEIEGPVMRIANGGAAFLVYGSTSAVSYGGRTVMPNVAARNAVIVGATSWVSVVKADNIVNTDGVVFPAALTIDSLKAHDASAATLFKLFVLPAYSGTANAPSDSGDARQNVYIDIANIKRPRTPNGVENAGFVSFGEPVSGWSSHYQNDPNAVVPRVRIRGCENVWADVTIARGDVLIVDSEVSRIDTYAGGNIVPGPHCSVRVVDCDIRPISSNSSDAAPYLTAHKVDYESCRFWQAYKIDGVSTWSISLTGGITGRDNSIVDAATYTNVPAGFLRV